MAKKFKTIGGKKYYQQAFAIPGKASQPDTWKLPHHGSGDTSHDKLSVDWERLPLAAGAVASGQFRGQALDATTEERKRAARHLLAHYRKAKKTPPDSLLAYLGLEESMKRKIGKGKPLTELVKGSLTYTLRQIEDDFEAAFITPGGDWYPWVVEVFEGYVIVKDRGLARDEYYRVSYEKQGSKYVFAPRGDWEVVELTYQPQTLSERRKKFGSDNSSTRNQPRRFEERIVQQLELLESEGEGKPRRVRAVGITADVVNANNRRYRKVVLQQAIDELRGHLHESAGQGRLKQLLGEAEHPSDKPTRRPNLLETVIVWQQVNLPGDQVILEGQLLETSKGQDVQALIAGGVQIGVSQRAYGESKMVREGGRMVEDVTELHITGYDLVLEPSDPHGGIEEILESRRKHIMDPKEILALLQESGLFDELKADLQKELREAMKAENRERQEKALREALGIGPQDDLLEAVQAAIAGRQPAGDGELEESLREMLGLKETDNLQEALEARQKRMAELEEAERQRDVEAYITEQTKDLPYPDFLKTQMVEAIRARKPGDKEAAKKVLLEKRAEYDAIVAQMRLAARGYGGLNVIGPVLETETGVPEFARGAHLLTEAMVNTGQALPRKWNRDAAEMSIGERFARAYLERFDQNFKHQLQQESKLISEAEQTTDLSLPYSVARAVVAEAVPELVAASIFDLGITDQSPSRIYYEAYADESGVENDVTDEEVTIVALDTWYDLDYKRVQPGTVVVQDDSDTTTYTEGTDYAVDYGSGRIRALTGGSISASDVLHVDYTYDALRLGEMQGIQKAKMTLSNKTLEIAADRLATQISKEVIVFARSQLGWDATGRTLAGLVRRIREAIDKHLLYLGLSAALSVASNSGGTWSATPSGGDTYDENLDKLFRYLGVAKVKVANRHYEPNFILTSVTMGDVLSNSKQFTNAGQRPDADLNAAGYVGRAKGLPVFSSTQFSDGYMLVGNRELVMHRVYRAMELIGPLPSFDASRNIIAADQYYAEEFNGSDAPVLEKGSYVIITS